MGTTLVIAETFGGKLRKSTLNAITFARTLAGKTGGDFAIGLLGSGVAGIGVCATTGGDEGVGGGLRAKGSDSGRVPWSSLSSKASRSWTTRQWPAACFLATRGHRRRPASPRSSTVMRPAA